MAPNPIAGNGAQATATRIERLVGYLVGNRLAAIRGLQSGIVTAAVNTRSRAGPLLREWRKRQRLSQLELALDAGISARHLSFIETGRSRPSAQMLLLLAEQLEIPFRERNHLLLAGGYAPAFPQRSLEDPELTPVREALELILTGHEPYPAVVLDRYWNVVAGNGAQERRLALSD